MFKVIMIKGCDDILGIFSRFSRKNNISSTCFSTKKPLNKVRFRRQWETKSEGDGQLVQCAARPIWQVKQRWARRFDLASAKILIFKEILLQTMKQQFFLKFNYGHSSRTTVTEIYHLNGDDDLNDGYPWRMTEAVILVPNISFVINLSSKAGFENFEKKSKLSKLLCNTHNFLV
jgi:hypothetical protein